MNSIQADKFRQMIVVGANKLEENKKMVDEMNVFPVPDGDTGTNMSLTVTSAVKEVLSSGSSSVSDLSKAVSSGALRGARGNSGVILSQLFRGFYKGIKGSDEVNAVSLATGMQKGVETAYKAVMKPKEGTILTVAKGAASAAVEEALKTDDIVAVMQAAVTAGEETLAKTPELLPVLKDAGVVDSGGQGLVLIYEGFLDALKRDDTELDALLALSKDGNEQPVKQEDVYCVELVIETSDADKAGQELEGFLPTVGEKSLVDAEGKKVSLHVHTKNPGSVLTKAQEFGSLAMVKVENMRLSHNHVLNLQQKQKPQAPAKPVGFVTISAGSGLAQIFQQLGVDYVISGGQTMNPSTDDIIKAVDQVNAKDVFVLPNNKNIILAAEQAQKLVKDKQLHVIPTRNIPQGISAMISYMPGESVDDNIAGMNDGISSVVSGSVTYAIRDTSMNGFTIQANDILALKNEDIVNVGKDLKETTCQLLDSMIGEDTSIVTIYYGKDATQDQADELKAYVTGKYPQVEVEVNEGGQPIYYFLLSAE